MGVPVSKVETEKIVTGRDQQGRRSSKAGPGKNVKENGPKDKSTEAKSTKGKQYWVKSGLGNGRSLGVRSNRMFGF